MRHKSSLALFIGWLTLSSALVPIHASQSGPPPTPALDDATGNGNTAQAMKTEGAGNGAISPASPSTPHSAKPGVINPANGYPVDPRAPTEVPPGCIALPKVAEQRNQKLQDGMNGFPLLKPTTDAQGHPTFQTLTLDKPLVIGNQEYFGFRFTVPTRQHDEDLVWAFISPRENKGWYFEPPNGITYGQPNGVMNYFESFFWPPRTNFDIPKGLPPTAGNHLGLQILDGKRISDGETYLIWINLGPRHANGMSVMFTFASFDPAKPITPLAIEKVLNLKRKPAVAAPSPTSKPQAPAKSPTVDPSTI